MAHSWSIRRLKLVIEQRHDCEHNASDELQQEEQLNLWNTREVFCLDFSVLSWSDRAFLSERIITMNHQHIPSQPCERDGKPRDRQLDTEMINSLLPPLSVYYSLYPQSGLTFLGLYFLGSSSATLAFNSVSLHVHSTNLGSNRSILSVSCLPY